MEAFKKNYDDDLLKNLKLDELDRVSDTVFDRYNKSSFAGEDLSDEIY